MPQMCQRGLFWLGNNAFEVYYGLLKVTAVMLFTVRAAGVQWLCYYCQGINSRMSRAHAWQCTPLFFSIVPIIKFSLKLFSPNKVPLSSSKGSFIWRHAWPNVIVHSTSPWVICR